MRRFSILAVAFFAVFFPALAQSGKLLWSKDTSWGQVRVREQAHLRFLTFADQDGETEESRMDMRQPHRPIQNYLRQMLAATALWESQRRTDNLQVLVVGLGAGSLTNALTFLFPDATVTSVDIEPAVVEAAKRYFGLKTQERSRVVVQDAREFLEDSDQRYDVIFLDAFDGLEVPESLRTVEFTRLLAGRLTPRGAVIANIHFAPEISSLRYQRSLVEALPHRLVFAGLAQGTGVFTSRPVQVGTLPTNLEQRYSLPLNSLLKIAQDVSFDGVEPYRDGQESP